MVKEIAKKKEKKQKRNPNNNTKITHEKNTPEKERRNTLMFLYMLTDLSHLTEVLMMTRTQKGRCERQSCSAGSHQSNSTAPLRAPREPHLGP